jgi:uncharacterized protein (TIGR00251 family)
MDEFVAAVRETSRGAVISIEVTAGSRKNAFPAGYNPWRRVIGCHVTAPALEGKANRAVIDLIAHTLEVARFRVSIISGMNSPIKKVLVEGITVKTVIGYLKKGFSES